ncbi:TIGR04086 family membrane protein [Bacillus carboniphilus]|uniref:TIGR04086 family membrane protein n=1 Tax=Bacillus carboniphilus TaxID=86663 RepID=A0ABY9K2N5_9BACI|nr:TIGR04086 family membrane protein [Bacillus carboniphilus]WLR44060.1 TIGR04086 family membrane protein [Bacillus carboniphilus]
MDQPKRFGKAILYGLITIFSIALVVSFLFTFLLKFTDLTEESIYFPLLILSFLAVFIGGLISGGIGQEKGWFIGGITALCYTLIIALFQYLGYASSLSTSSLLHHLGFLITAMVGGMFGVNTLSKNFKS